LRDPTSAFSLTHENACGLADLHRRSSPRLSPLALTMLAAPRRSCLA